MLSGDFVFNDVLAFSPVNAPALVQSQTHCINCHEVAHRAAVRCVLMDSLLSTTFPYSRLTMPLPLLLLDPFRFLASIECERFRISTRCPTRSISFCLFAPFTVLIPMSTLQIFRKSRESSDTLVTLFLAVI